MLRILAVAAIAAFAVSTQYAPAYAADSCATVANSVVKDAVEDVLGKAVKDNPELKKLSQKELVKRSGNVLLTAERPGIQAYGFMMLMWYGDQADRDKVAKTAAALQTEQQRAHFYFVLGLNQIRSKTPKVAAEGRDYIRQIRDTGHVTFVNDAMWKSLIDDCQLSQ